MANQGQPRPALLFPLSLAGSHQVANARELVAAGGAEMIDGTAARAADVAHVLGDLLADRERLTKMGSASRSLYRREAATDVADLLAEVAGAK